MVNNLGMDSKKPEYIPISVVYEDFYGDIVFAKTPRMTPNSKHISIKYHWFRQNFGKEFVSKKIEYVNHKTYILTKGLQGVFFQYW